MNRGGFHLPPPRFDINTGAGRKQGGMTLNEQETKEPYTWDDLDGKRPTMNEYREQERRKCENMN